MAISMCVRLHLLELGPPLDEGALAWELPGGLLNARDTPLLMGVDPFGYTVFNRVQIDNQLPGEVAFLRTAADPRVHAVLDELDRLIAVAQHRVHRYVWFLGD